MATINSEIKQNIGMLRGELRQLDQKFSMPGFFDGRGCEILRMPDVLNTMRDRVTTFQDIALGMNDAVLILDASEVNEIFERIWNSCLKERNQIVKKEINIHLRGLSHYRGQLNTETYRNSFRRVEKLLTDSYLPTEYYDKLAKLHDNLATLIAKKEQNCLHTDNEHRGTFNQLDALLNAARTNDFGQVRAIVERINPKYKDMLHSHMYMLHKRDNKIPHEHMDYGNMAFNNRSENSIDYTATAADRQAVINRVRNEIVLTAFLNILQGGGPITDLRRWDSALDRDLQNKMYGYIYQASSEHNRITRDLSRGRNDRDLDLIRLNHADFGRVAFRGEEGFEAPSDLKIVVVKRLLSELKDTI